MMNNHMPSMAWDEIGYPFQNFNGCIVEVWEGTTNFIPRASSYILLWM